MLPTRRHQQTILWLRHTTTHTDIDHDLGDDLDPYFDLGDDLDPEFDLDSEFELGNDLNLTLEN